MHWIELILKRNITLPDYQRLFVWNEDKVKNLITALKENQFVPPVTIGALKKDGKTQNIILDGQQRLTSILLAHLELFPVKSIYKCIQTEKNADENDNEINDDDEPFDDMLDWRFDKLTNKGTNLDEIKKNINMKNYKNMKLGIAASFLKDTFLGFSYLVPLEDDPKQEQKYYSTVFRSINYQGEKLSVQESRKSLYFLADNLAGYFDPSFFKDIKIRNNNVEYKIDFVRFLSLLSQYKKIRSASGVAKGYKSDMEKFYEEYIYSITGNNISEMFDDFSTTFPDNNYSQRFKLLENTIDNLEIPKRFTSIIDSDMYLFGLIYTIVFTAKEINATENEKIHKEIENTIKEYKEDKSHTKTPSSLKHLRSRIERSIQIYCKYEK